MSIQGIMLCVTCREKIHLGKLAFDRNRSPVDFVDSIENKAVLSQKMRLFAAAHIRHEVRVVTDQIFDKELDDFDYEYNDECYGDSSYLEVNNAIRERKRSIDRDP